MSSSCPSNDQWREASTLIIVTQSSSVSKICPSNAGEHKNIVISEFDPSINDNGLNGPQFRDESDYRILMVKRSYLSSFMASAYVFPGGAIEKSDFSPKWWQIFGKFGFDQLKLAQQMSARISGSRPPILQDPLMVRSMKESGQWSNDHLTPDIAFRIAAIRETFEETGVALFIDSNCNHDKNQSWSAWRKSIRDGSTSFVDFCIETNQCPDIWSLYEWWNWLTPVSVGHRRFDTMFYVCCLDYQPEVILDDVEVTSLEWSSAGEMIRKHAEDGIFLAPPQVYELSRIDNLPDFRTIRTFARERERYGVQQWMPVMATFTDGICSLLPGDDLYPVKLDLFGNKPLLNYSVSMNESRSLAINLNRIKLQNGVFSCVCNQRLTCGHLSPISDLTIKPLRSML
ncbi:acyl-coenzyme A diphosphatase NUDT19-like [Brevipalpus obovatus]|uniref:acyl-coenzyme A diphosphatase NUDT19-like n=1 Tax=Brevipalpus obovatus TaxID=246614 RepID=UPI003D9F81DE